MKRKFYKVRVDKPKNLTNMIITQEISVVVVVAITTRRSPKYTAQQPFCNQESNNKNDK